MRQNTRRRNRILTIVRQHSFYYHFNTIIFTNLRPGKWSPVHRQAYQCRILGSIRRLRNSIRTASDESMVLISPASSVGKLVIASGDATSSWDIRVMVRKIEPLIRVWLKSQNFLLHITKYWIHIYWLNKYGKSSNHER
jgi:hypothetical protein